MAKRPSLSESMKAVVKDATRTGSAAQSPSPDGRDDSSQFLSGAAPVSGYRAKTREGMKRLTVVVPPEEHRRVKRLSVDTDRSIEDLMREALASLLDRHNA